MLFFGYGYEGITAHIPNISKVYQHALAKGIDVDTRAMLEAEMVQLVDSGKLLPVVFLPFLVLDDAIPVTTKAAIDFVSSSDYVNGELYAFKELSNLFKLGSLANRGAVFGSLVAMGDEEVLSFLEELLPLLSTEEFKEASRVHTQYPQHYAIQFWLKCAKKLVASPTENDQKMFGSCASALKLVLRYDGVGKVASGKRNFPCQKYEHPITDQQFWTIEEYARLISKELYSIEEIEARPRLFSDVLRQWGLEPRSSLIDQFIPESGDEFESFQVLRDPERTSEIEKSEKLFLQKIFGKQ
jgi:hypothetical protein